jgi:hypothetical protein
MITMLTPWPKSRRFVRPNNLVGLKDTSQDINSILESNIDMGAVFSGRKSPINQGKAALLLCRKIHFKHPELPIFFASGKKVNPRRIWIQKYRRPLPGAYTLSNITRLQELVDQYVCSM